MDDHDHQPDGPDDGGNLSGDSEDESEQPRVEESMLEDEADADEAEREVASRYEQGGHGDHRERDHVGQDGHDGHTDHGDPDGQDGHGDGGMHAGHEAMFRRRFFVSAILSIPVLLYSETLQELLGFSVPAVPGSAWITPVLSVVIFAYGGVPFLRMAAPEVRARSPGMMTLISMAILVAFGYSLASLVVPGATAFFWELVTLVDVMLLGHWIEMRSVRRASSALDELARLLPDTAERIVEDGDSGGRATGSGAAGSVAAGGDETEEVPVSDLRAGDLVLVRPGASVPADGVVESGDSDVNEAMITGESRPVSKEAGDEVIGGTINGDGSLRVHITATGEETALAGIVRLVREAQESESRSQVLADRAAGWLFYVAVAAAAVTTVAWIGLVGLDSMVVERAVTVLVIACPHALGLAIPLVVAINTSLAARNGMLVRDRVAVERARDLDVVVFDKTGTLTEGEQGVVGMETVAGVSGSEALSLAAAVEADSEHMIAEAIREAAGQRGVSIPTATGFEAKKGRGVRATVDGAALRAAGLSSGDKPRDGEEIAVGGPNLLAGMGANVPEELASFAREAGENARTVVYLLRGDQPIAAFALADVIRPESYRVVETLHDLGVEVAMLTGDSEGVARAVAEELGIDTYFAEVLPEEKDEKIADLQDEGKLVGMVGDGVNDAPALARADVGVAIGSGTDVAVRSADVVLVRNDPTDVVRLVRLSRASYRKMQENLVWAAGYNVFAIPLAAGILAPWGVLLSPAVGALLMSASTVVVAANAQLLRRLDLDLPTIGGPSVTGEPQPAG